MINSLDMNQILLGLIHDLDSRWTCNVTLCYLTITECYAMQVPKVLATCKTLPGTLTSFYIRYSQMTDNVWHFSPHSIVIKSNGSATLNVNVLLSMHIIYIYTRAESSPGNLSQCHFTSLFHFCRAYLAKGWG